MCGPTGDSVVARISAQNKQIVKNSTETPSQAPFLTGPSASVVYMSEKKVPPAPLYNESSPTLHTAKVEVNAL